MDASTTKPLTDKAADVELDTAMAQPLSIENAEAAPKRSEAVPSAINDIHHPAESDQKTVAPDIDVLHEFDPLADEPEPMVTSQARDETPIEVIKMDESEISSKAPQPPPKDIISSETLSSLTFPQSTLSAIARTFSIPIKTRPTSMDIARPVPSPSKLSSLVARHQQAPSTEPSPSSSPSPSANPTPLPKPEVSPEVAHDEPPAFDFQKFLDQMKHRSAEPVAKFLRS